MNIRLYHPNSIVENATSLLSKEHTHYVVNVMREGFYNDSMIYLRTQLVCKN